VVRRAPRYARRCTGSWPQIGIAARCRRAAVCRPVLEESAGRHHLQIACRFGSAEFRRFETWLGKVVSWADHDALAMYLIGPLLVADPRRVKRPLRWAVSRSHWRRRAAAVSLIHGVRRGLFGGGRRRRRLLADRDDMVRKAWVAPARMGQHDPGAAVPVGVDCGGARGRAHGCELTPGCVRILANDTGGVVCRARSRSPGQQADFKCCRLAWVPTHADLGHCGVHELTIVGLVRGRSQHTLVRSL
jgi:hypothetical protein